MLKHTAIAAAIQLAIECKYEITVYRNPSLLDGTYEKCASVTVAMLPEDCEIVCKVLPDGSVVQVPKQQKLCVEYVNRLVERLRNLRTLVRNIEDELFELPDVKLADLLEEFAVLDRQFGKVAKIARTL